MDMINWIWGHAAAYYSAMSSSGVYSCKSPFIFYSFKFWLKLNAGSAVGMLWYVVPQFLRILCEFVRTKYAKVPDFGTYELVRGSLVVQRIMWLWVNL
jgi:hypothetical protein